MEGILPMNGRNMVRFFGLENWYFEARKGNEKTRNE